MKHIETQKTIPLSTHDDVIKIKNIFRVTGPLRGEIAGQKGQWRGALMFSLICAWTNSWVNNRDAGDLRRHRTHYDVIVITSACIIWCVGTLRCKQREFMSSWILYCFIYTLGIYFGLARPILNSAKHGDKSNPITLTSYMLRKFLCINMLRIAQFVRRLVWLSVTYVFTWVH